MVSPLCWLYLGSLCLAMVCGFWFPQISEPNGVEIYLGGVEVLKHSLGVDIEMQDRMPAAAPSNAAPFNQPPICFFLFFFFIFFFNFFSKFVV